MADLKNNASAIYKSIVSLVSGNVSSALKRLQDGDGNNTALSLSNIAAKIFGDLEVTGAITGDGSGLTNLPQTTPTLSVRNVTADDDLLEEDDVVIIQGDHLFDLLEAASVINKEIIIKCYGTSITDNVRAVTGESIDGNNAEITVNNKRSVKLLSDGNEWHITSDFN